MATTSSKDRAGEYVHVERRKVIIEMQFRSPTTGSTAHRGRRERDDEDAIVRRMKREGLFV